MHARRLRGLDMLRRLRAMQSVHLDDAAGVPARAGRRMDLLRLTLNPDA